VIRDARNSGHRIFTVGVGSAVTETFLRRLADECSGACELVSPNEEMARRIHRQFERMYAPRAQEVTVSCPIEATERFPKVIGTV